MLKVPPQNRKRRAVRRGFTLIELLVVVAIIALLISILLPSLSAARETARTVACSSVMRQFGFANQMYADASDNWYVTIRAAPFDLPEGMWAWNSKYRAMLGLEPVTLADLNHGDGDLHGGYPSGFVCPSAPALKRELGDIAHSLGMNTSVFDPGLRNKYFITPDGQSIQRTAIQRPAATVQAADANAWYTGVVQADYHTRWNVYAEAHNGGVWSGGPSVAYRHTDGANLQFFDGHVEYATQDEAWPGEWDPMWDMIPE